MKKMETNKIAFYGLFFLLLVFAESVLFGNGHFILVLLSAGLIYFGTKRQSKSLFIAGLIFLLISLFTLWSLRLIILLSLVSILYKMWNGTPAEEIMRPIREYKKETPNGIWKNKLFSVQSSPFSSYEWEDIHIQGLFGDIYVDVTETVLPKGTSLISVRQGFGKIKLEVPYEIPVRVHYTTLIGEAKILGHHHHRLINEFLHMKDGYENDSSDHTELIITLSTWIGDVEVIRK